MRAVHEELGPMGEGSVVGDVESLFRAHYVALVRLAVLFGMDGHSAEEVVQDAFVRFRPERVGSGAELAYLRRTVINLAKGRHRRLAVARRHPPPPALDAAPAEDVAARRRRDEQVVAAVQDLPARQRACVLLHYFAGLTDREVAATLKISAGSVKTHLHRARSMLRTALEDER
jgi:RNA polymerase sigma factor (sigma-70 family)